MLTSFSRAALRGGIACGVLSLLCFSTAQAGTTVIDFEEFADGDSIGAVPVFGNTVTLTVGSTAGGAAPGVIEAIGSPVGGFVPGDTPAAGVGGSFFLTDEIGPGSPLSNRFNYYLDFATEVFNLSLDLYDFRTDGGGAVGDIAKLTVYSDAARTTEVGSDTFTVTAGLVDGNVAPLSVLSPTGLIKAASLEFFDSLAPTVVDPQDVGTGIDNIRFETVPEPTSAALFGMGLAAAGVVRRRRRKIS